MKEKLVNLCPTICTIVCMILLILVMASIMLDKCVCSDNIWFENDVKA